MGEVALATQDAIPLSDLPVFWDDTRLLHHEPFLSHFALRKVIEEETYGTRRPKKKDDLYIAMWDARKEMEKAYEYWVLLCFGIKCSSSMKIENAKADAKAKVKVKGLRRSDVYSGRGRIWKTFIDIFWFLHQKQTKSAELLMADVRTKSGYKHAFSLMYSDKLHKNHRRVASSELSMTLIWDDSEVFSGGKTKGETTSASVASEPPSYRESVSNLSIENDALSSRPTKKRKKEKSRRSMMLIEVEEGSIQVNVKQTQLLEPTTMPDTIKNTSTSKKHTKPEKVKKGEKKRNKLRTTSENGKGTSADSVDKPNFSEAWVGQETESAFTTKNLGRPERQSPVEKDSTIVVDNTKWKASSQPEAKDTQTSLVKGKGMVPNHGERGIGQPINELKGANSSSSSMDMSRKKRSRNDDETTSQVPPSSITRLPKNRMTQQTNKRKRALEQCDMDIVSQGTNRNRVTSNALINSTSSMPSNLHCRPMNKGVLTGVPIIPTDGPASVLGFPSSQSTPQLAAPKPALPVNVRPRIWAASRQALCETATWFRAYQGGVYFSKGMAYGYLLGSFSSQRDVWRHDGKLIISHGGGGAKVYNENSSTSSTKIVVASDQDDRDYSVQSLIKRFETGTPIVLIVDDTYEGFPFDLGKYTYAVLGYYKIINAWAEMEQSLNDRGRCIKYKFEFQWCEGQETPWWNVKSEGNILNDMDIDTNTIYHREPKEERGPKQEEALLFANADASCSMCKKTSPTVYLEGWVCLQPGCKRFWKSDNIAFDSLHVNYRPDFLSLRFAVSVTPELAEVRPYCPEQHQRVQTRLGPSIRGWWCNLCGQLCCREKWELWECTNCNNSEADPGVSHSRVLSPKEFWSQNRGFASRNYILAKGSGIEHKSASWTVEKISAPLDTFILPDNRGRIYLVGGQQRGKINERADKIFEDYQRVATDGDFFRRYPLRVHKCRGRLLANYFSQNSGAPYKYVAGTGKTVPFDEAPEVVRNALQLIKDRVSYVHEADVDFNEVLTAAYMEEQSMSYHTDSEEGLGPVVSSLSLGSAAWMHFRLRHVKISSKSKPRQRELSILLRHGDVLVMDGAQIQNVYEHTVEPQGVRIAATARVIGENNLNTCATPIRGDRR